MRLTPFANRQVWVAQKNPFTHESVFFIIIGKGKNKDYKRCVVHYQPYPLNVHAWWNQWQMPKLEGRSIRASRKRPPMVSEYSHKHLKKYAKPLDRSVFEKAMIYDAAIQRLANEREAIFAQKPLDLDAAQKRLREIEAQGWILWDKYHALLMGRENYLSLFNDSRKEIEEHLAA